MFAAVHQKNQDNPWLFPLIGLIAAAIATYYVTLNAMNDRITTVTVKEQDHYEQLHTDMQELKADVKDIKAKVK